MIFNFNVCNSKYWVWTLTISDFFPPKYTRSTYHKQVFWKLVLEINILCGRFHDKSILYKWQTSWCLLIHWKGLKPRYRDPVLLFVSEDGGILCRTWGKQHFCFLNFTFILCMHMFCLHICMCTTWVPGTWGGQKREYWIPWNWS